MDTEVKVVALIARGDSYDEIRAETGISKMAISAIKKRNADNLAVIKQQKLRLAEKDAESIRDKANEKISGRLIRDDNVQKVLDKAYADYSDDVITFKEFEQITRRIKELSMNELLGVSREMHSQTTKSDKPPAKASDMADLIAAIRSGDEVSVTKAVFNANSETTV